MPLIPSSVVEKSWRQALSRLESGRLEFTAPNGELTIAGGKLPGPNARFQIRDWDVLRRIMARGDIGLGEEFIAGSWETDDVEALVSLFLLNLDQLEDFSHGSFLNRLGFVIHNALVRRNSIAGSARNIKAHYDVGNEFYSLWLDKSMTYSSALYQDAKALYEAQQNKYDRILSKFEKPRASVLEIGCGWGGFAERAADAQHHVTGLTISPAQHKFATERMSGRADIRLEDYRKAKGTFDNIVSIEMFEAVGEHYWPQYFATVAERLKQGGRAIVQTITIRDDLFADYRSRSDFIRHYVFPGGMLPSLGRFRDEAERAGLKFAGAFAFGKDYARTLREWSERMQERSSEIMALGHDQRFLRNWQFYLGICAAAFSVERTNVVQVELVNA
ncbi:MAG TPA: cyclopropane-fatty-acyl-phospholipid synthase family protein [Rhizomicrobium sp.]|jgi:cyclopropane-fatty-acyl-phospholipid synthase|nr:cyclopropane-fatty-acyl-phospholipid synthase family protein [Rhizomicrobium sp.]